MTINAVLPPFMELIPVLKAWYFQRRDQNWSNDKHSNMYHTKATQIYCYLDLYSGPNHMIHFKYSVLLNMTYVTMMYGLGMPALFPIAAIGYFIFWLTERYQIAYTY